MELGGVTLATVHALAAGPTGDASDGEPAAIQRLHDVRIDRVEDVTVINECLPATVTIVDDRGTTLVRLVPAGPDEYSSPPPAVTNGRHLALVTADGTLHLLQLDGLVRGRSPSP